MCTRMSRAYTTEGQLNDRTSGRHDCYSGLLIGFLAGVLVNGLEPGRPPWRALRG